MNRTRALRGHVPPLDESAPSTRLGRCLAALAELDRAITDRNWEHTEQARDQLAERLLSIEDVVGVSTPPALFDLPATRPA